MFCTLIELRSLGKQKAACSCDPPSFSTAGLPPWLNRMGTLTTSCAASTASSSSCTAAQNKQVALQGQTR